MRLSQNDRRSLKQLIKMRLAPLLKSKLQHAPLAVIITATIWLSPSALAQVTNPQNKNIKIHSQTLSSETGVEKTYTKDELNKKKPEPAVTMGKTVGNQLISLINSIGKSKDLKNHQSSQQSRRDYFQRASFSLDTSNDTAVNPDNIRGQINTDAQKVVQNKTIEQTEVWKKLNGGFDFKLDFGKIFGNKTKTEPTPENKKGRVRYGLVLKNVTPDADPNKQRAAIGAEDELQYAGTADVEWTIGPIYDDDNGDHAIFHSNANIYASGDTSSNRGSTSVENRSGQDGDLWDQVSLPSPAFDISAKPENMDTVKDFIQKNEQLGMKVTLTQVQNLYQLTTLTPNKAKKRTTNESIHKLNLPIYGTMSLSRTYKSVGRRLTDKMKVTRTSVNSVLLSKKYPDLSFHYDHSIDQYSSDMKISNSSGEYSLTARTDAKKTSDAEKAKEKSYNKTYEIGYNKPF